MKYGWLWSAAILVVVAATAHASTVSTGALNAKGLARRSTMGGDGTDLPRAQPATHSPPANDLYFDLHPAAGAEDRGQILAVTDADTESDITNPNGSTATSIPLPPALLLGLAGLGIAGWATRRRRFTR